MGGPLKRERAVDLDKSTTVRFFRGSLPIGTSQSDTIDAITEHAIVSRGDYSYELHIWYLRDMPS
ncbi:MAG: hypothetical protein CM15mP82_5510 [Methanobacteriota archaeon]|nr:MAG: hypothetical protein CM15mP82_5510 [Euryarchaeota archaeon]